MTDEPPALTLESDASKILLRLWRGERYVFHSRPPQTPSGTTLAFLEVASTVTAHLHLRAGLRVHVIGNSATEIIDLHRSLRTAMPTTAIGLPDGLATDVIPAAELIPVPDIGLQHLEVSGPWNEDPTFGLIDLVIVLSGKHLQRDNLVRYLNGARQLLVLGYNRHASALYLRDRTDLEPPIDVVIAGGEFG